MFNFMLQNYDELSTWKIPHYGHSAYHVCGICNINWKCSNINWKCSNINWKCSNISKKQFGFSKMEILTPDELVERINRR